MGEIEKEFRNIELMIDDAEEIARDILKKLLVSVSQNKIPENYVDHIRYLSELVMQLHTVNLKSESIFASEISNLLDKE